MTDKRPDTERYRSLVRLLVLRQRVEERGWATPAVIAGELGVSERTARRYLNALREAMRVAAEVQTARAS